MRLPYLIWRFLFADLLRVGLVTAAGLVTVIAFAVTIKFLADGRVDLAGGVRLMTLALAPMLQYALPFAAGFGATLAYHRFAADNEATATMASGIGHLSILVPALAMGLGVGVTLFALAHQAIPRFLRQMEETITRDLTGVFVRTIERGESERLGDWGIHASSVVQAGPEPSVGAIERLRLNNVLAVQLDSEGVAEGSMSAEAVDVWLFEIADTEEPATVAQFVFRGYTAEGEVDSFHGERGASQRVRISSAFSDDPKFLTWSELRGLRRNPERIKKVESLRRRLALELDQRRLISDVRDRLVTEGRVVLDRGEGERVIVYGSDLEPRGDGWVASAPVNPPGPQGSGAAGRTLRIDNELGSGSVYIHRAAEVRFTLEHSGEGGVLLADRAALRLTADNVATFDEQLRAAPTVRERIILTSLSLPLGAGANPMEADVAALQEAAAEVRTVADGTGRGASVADASRRLRERVEDLQREVTSKQHERAAYSLASVVTMLCGSVVALRRQYALPLPVYLWSFFPALGAVITISAGQGLTHRVGAGGLVLLWGGVLSLLGYTVFEYLRWRRQ